MSRNSTEKTSREPLAFERRPDESAKAFAAFKLYAEMGLNRSIRAVWQKLGKSKALIERWSGRYCWADRAAERDVYIERTAREAEVENLKRDSVNWAQRQREIREKDWKAAQVLRDKAAQMAGMPLTRRRRLKNGTVVTEPNFTAGDIPRFLEVASRLERLALGLATEKTEHVGPDNGPVIQAHPVVIFIPDNGRDGLIPNRGGTPSG